MSKKGSPIAAAKHAPDTLPAAAAAPAEVQAQGAAALPTHDVPPVRRPLLLVALFAAGILALAAWWYPVRGTWPADTAGGYFAALAAVPDGRIDLNAADSTALCTLPGIGPARAQAILDWRAANGPFTSAGQLLLVEGIGEKTLEALLPLVWVEGETS